MEEFLNKEYVLQSSENFEDYLEFMVLRVIEKVYRHKGHWRFKGSFIFITVPMSLGSGEHSPIGINYFSRKIASTLKMVQCLERNEDGTYTFHFKSKLASSQTKFIPGEEFEETKADGVKVKALITFEGDEMTHIQIESNGRTSKHVRKFYHDKLIVTTTAVGFDKTVTRVYELLIK